MPCYLLLIRLLGALKTTSGRKLRPSYAFGEFFELDLQLYDLAGLV